VKSKGGKTFLCRLQVGPVLPAREPGGARPSPRRAGGRVHFPRRVAADRVEPNYAAGMNARPAPIPLRPDPGAVSRANVTSLVRACVAAMVAATDPYSLRAEDVASRRQSTGMPAAP
jgi:hypothetical protein